MMRPMDDLWSRVARRWRPLVAATVGLALFGASALAPTARLASTLPVLAVVAFILAAALVVTTALTRRSADDVGGGADTPDAPGVDASTDAETAVALAEVAHERDVSMARASDAEERARLADDRLASLAPLEQRVEVAERRALDAERRLDEIDERVVAATIDDSGDTVGDPAATNEPTAVASRAAELRTRLARTAARKKPGSNR